MKKSTLEFIYFKIQWGSGLLFHSIQLAASPDGRLTHPWHLFRLQLSNKYFSFFSFPFPSVTQSKQLIVQETCYPSAKWFAKGLEVYELSFSQLLPQMDSPIIVAQGNHINTLIPHHIWPSTVFQNRHGTLYSEELWWVDKQEHRHTFLKCCPPLHWQASGFYWWPLTRLTLFFLLSVVKAAYNDLQQYFELSAFYWLGRRIRRD